ncbi:LPS assembly lipoprotein LptE [Vibrio sp. SCSIO 43136]|uniref:LPS-assembly lipoprotein LptE n=1 Tax=Vibrio sp. SCSIO 43136 TaxID=2819101 RepID=UPI002075C897|nr:LPS assembly lipoprotein LptE [Vibrio sp. SCSIO 43136]USD64656.1 luciferase [Vibrio sp. SCSIO 43136]
MSRPTLTTALRLFIVLLLSVLTTACGFQLRGTYLLPEEVSDISLTSFDQYGDLTRYVKHELYLNGISTVTPAADIPNLHITTASQSERTLSLYQNSRAAEYELTFVVNYRITVPELGDQSYSTTVNRTYLDNPLTALAKSEEKEMILDEMRRQAARQMMRQMARIRAKLEAADDTEQQVDQIDDGVTQTTTTQAQG